MFSSILLQAAGATPGGGMGSLGTLLFLGAAFAIIYFMMIRPQGRVRKEQSNFLTSLKKGKKVITISGVHGTIAGIEDKTLTLIIAPSVHITIQRDCISMDLTNSVYPATPNEPKTKETNSSPNVTAGQN